jgi:hypothetical protein
MELTSTPFSTTSEAAGAAMAAKGRWPGANDDHVRSTRPDLSPASPARRPPRRFSHSRARTAARRSSTTARHIPAAAGRLHWVNKTPRTRPETITGDELMKTTRELACVVALGLVVSTSAARRRGGVAAAARRLPRSGQRPKSHRPRRGNGENVERQAGDLAWFEQESRSRRPTRYRDWPTVLSIQKRTPMPICRRRRWCDRVVDDGGGQVRT